MNYNTVYVGMDVHKESFSLCAYTIEAEKASHYQRTEADYKKVLNYLEFLRTIYGELEYGSPKKPSIAEAVALSMADNMDAKLETLREALEAKDTNDWLGYNRWLDSNIRRTTNEF
jgi:23S rRNA maturation-related 3'-5' exoribonuclease YhaM